MKQPTMREVHVRDAIGMALAHDLTQIIPGKFKGRIFARGHIIREEDIPKLLDIGKEHIYTLDMSDGWLHEDDAALRMAAAMLGEGLQYKEPKEGKVTLTSDILGLAKVDPAFVHRVNALGEVALATIRTNTLVHPGQAVAATRVIPLVVPEDKVSTVEQWAQEATAQGGGVSPVRVLPFRSLRVGLITTGGEVFSGRIKDKFGPVVKRKVAEVGSEVIEQVLAPDDQDTIVAHIHRLIDKGVDMLLLTGGMSVDPDDRTPGAIKRAGADIVSYGTPMLPGSMLLMSYLKGIPVLGLPGCVMHDPYTSFDVLLPRICAGEIIQREDISSLGYGGLAHQC